MVAECFMLSVSKLFTVYLIRCYIKNSEKIFVFWLKVKVWCIHQLSNLTSVVKIWRHEFAEEF